MGGGGENRHTTADRDPTLRRGESGLTTSNSVAVIITNY